MMLPSLFELHTCSDKKKKINPWTLFLTKSSDYSFVKMFDVTVSFLLAWRPFCQLWKRELGPTQSSLLVSHESPSDDERLIIFLTSFPLDIKKAKSDWTMARSWKYSILKTKQVMTLVVFPSKKMKICYSCIWQKQKSCSFFQICQNYARTIYRA